MKSGAVPLHCPDYQIPPWYRLTSVLRWNSLNCSWNTLDHNELHRTAASWVTSRLTRRDQIHLAGFRRRPKEEATTSGPAVFLSISQPTLHCTPNTIRFSVRGGSGGWVGEGWRIKVWGVFPLVTGPTFLGCVFRIQWQCKVFWGPM